MLGGNCPIFYLTLARTMAGLQLKADPLRRQKDPDPVHLNLPDPNPVSIVFYWYDKFQ